MNQAGGEQEADWMEHTLRVFGQVGIPFMSMPVHLDNPGYHAGGYPTPTGRVHHARLRPGRMRQAELTKPYVDPVPPETTGNAPWRSTNAWWQWQNRSGCGSSPTPSDPPPAQHRRSPPQVVRGCSTRYPAPTTGCSTAFGTRYESGHPHLRGDPPLRPHGQDLPHHFRNVRGTLPSAGGYEEVALDDGDMNMFKILSTLQEVGFDGGLQIDHLPDYASDDRHQKIGSAYAVGYVKALLAALKA